MPENSPVLGSLMKYGGYIAYPDRISPRSSTAAAVAIWPFELETGFEKRAVPINDTPSARTPTYNKFFRFMPVRLSFHQILSTFVRHLLTISRQRIYCTDGREIAFLARAQHQRDKNLQSSFESTRNIPRPAWKGGGHKAHDVLFSRSRVSREGVSR